MTDGIADRLRERRLQLGGCLAFDFRLPDDRRFMTLMFRPMPAVPIPLSGTAAIRLATAVPWSNCSGNFRLRRSIGLLSA